MKSYQVAAQIFADKEVADMNAYVQASREEIKMLRALLQTYIAYTAPIMPDDMTEAMEQFIENTIRPIGNQIDSLYRKSIGVAPKA
jgi:hypothetical protein